MQTIARTAILCLFLTLLSVQLTGLSCLNEWAIPDRDSAYSQQSTAPADECPCHFTFVSSPSLTLYRSGPLAGMVTPPPRIYAFDARELLFRPPASA
jgi:hypothetical protein